MTLITESRDLPLSFKDALASWPTGVAVVTAASGDAYYGTTVATFHSLSLDPLMVQFSLGRNSQLLKLLEARPDYSISILSEGQSEASKQFATSSRTASIDLDGFATTAFGGSLPGIEGSVAILQCSLSSLVPAGDHVIVLGEVTAVEAQPEARPLVYFRRTYGGVTIHE